MTFRNLTRLLLCACASLCAAGAALAQDYPNRPIRVIVPYAAGGGTDIVARAVVERLQAALGQAVVIDNRSGAGTVIGTDAVAKSTPDGYTLLFTSSAFTINPTLVTAGLPYDTEKAFVPVANASFHPFVLVASPALKVKSVKGLIDYAKRNPGTLSYASVGNGSSQHIEMELFKHAAGIDMLHVPYRGSAPAVSDLLGGQVLLMFNGISPTLQHIRAGKLVALAVDSPRRVPLLKDVPTLVEAGLTNFRFTTWSGLLAPAGTPQPIVDRLATEMHKIVTSKDFIDKLAAMGLEAGGPAKAQYASFLREDELEWRKLVKESGARLE
jgi:tripartite-type tricarboxylate transporter receptor subunit TctC